MEVLEPWMWEVWKMPPDEVERLTPRRADRFIQRGLDRVSSSG